ncbi:MAG: hypothetical protein LH609_02680, partial [Rudanella sp.]|nr:hypothetical protein [Rudanella sp.]
MRRYDCLKGQVFLHLTFLCFGSKCKTWLAVSAENHYFCGSVFGEEYKVSNFSLLTTKKMSGLIGKKIGMTSVYNADGQALACTVIETGPCVVTQVRT